MTAKPIPLGPFELRRLIGRGGMAEVWRGVHVGQNVPVAIKVITAERAREPQFLAAFANEVRAVARLHHPGIVLVLDHGEVSEEASAASNGKLAPKSPYLAMELASWGALDRVKTPLRWDDLAKLLLSLLDALAHAHARGVIHRDLKPGNVLLCSDEDPRPGLKLTDFGIAHALEGEARPGGAEASSGTPHFMSPEQFLGQWRDYGPWTDLYAVGCVAHLLATGEYPFQGDNPLKLAWAHMNLAPPPLRSQYPLPDGFESWVKRLMEKNPRDRFQRAADAGWSLMAMSEAFKPKTKTSRGKDAHDKETDLEFRPADITSRIEATPDPTEPPTLLAPARVTKKLKDSNPADTPTELAHVTIPDLKKFTATVLKSRPAGTLPWFDESSSSRGSHTPPPVTTYAPEPTERTEREVVSAPRRIPPLPKTWRRATSPGPSMQLIGAGLRLYGLRSIPMVDRHSERDLIWQALRTVRELRAAQLILLHGSAGNGKSRIVEWMSQRADEVGSAIILKATHSPIPGAADGIPRMLSRQLRCTDLSREEARKRAEHILRGQGVTDAGEWNALTELMFPSGVTGTEAPSANVIRFGSATERHVLVRRFIERLAGERPVIVWLEDVQWGSDAINFALHMIKAQSQPQTRSPALLLLTVRDEALAERPLEAKMLEELMAQRSASRLHVPPLSKNDQEQLVKELLLLEGELARDVAARTGGNPLFAVQLVGDWVQRGVLEVGQKGFQLQRGERAVLPDDIHSVWTGRIERVLSLHPPAAKIALELAAVLGHDVDSGEWEAAAKEAGVEASPKWVETLLQSRLAQTVEGGWTFAHGMLRESLERTAREAGRHADHHRACARMLARRYGSDAPGISERIGVHLLAALDLGAAMGPLLRGAAERFEKSEYQEANALLEERERALSALKASEDDVRYGEGWLLFAKIATHGGRLDEAESWAQRAEVQARRWGWKEILPDALFELATVSYERGDHVSATERFSQAMDLYGWIESELGIARCHTGTGDVLYRLGDLDGAEDRYDLALELFEANGDAMGMATALWGLGYVALWRNELDSALGIFERQLNLLEGAGNRFKIGRCVTALGEVARQKGSLDVAESNYRRALAIDEAIGSASVWVDRMNLSLVFLARGEWREAGRMISTVLAGIGENGQTSQLAVVHSELLAPLAADKDWDGFDRHLAQAKQLLEETGMKDGDVAWVATLAGERALASGDPARARQAFELSLQQWKGLGRPDKVDELERRIARLK